LIFFTLNNKKALILTLIISSCESEGLYLKRKSLGKESKVIVKYLHGKEASFASNLLKKNFGNQLNFGNTEMRSSEQETLIDFNNILLITDTLGIKNYTFRIINHPDDNFKTFHNLVLTQKEFELKGTIMKYEMTDLFAQDYNTGLKSFYEFQGKIKANSLTPIEPIEPCIPIQISYPSDPINGGGSNPVDPSNPVQPISSSGGSSSGCTSMNVSYDCSCGRSYGSWASYANSICGDGTNPGYSLTITIDYTILLLCRTATDPCIPDGSIGVLEPDEDCNTSKEDLMLAFPNLSDENAEILANTINLYGNDFGIDTNFKLNHFLSQIAHETGGLSNLNRSENMNYTNGNRLVEVFPTRFSYTNPNKANPDEYIGNAEKIGNYVYCCRMGNGSVISEEGYKYRGRGLIQLTGKTNYQNFQNYYNQKYPNDTIDIINNPETVSDSVEIAVLSAMWYFKTSVINKTLLIDNLNEPVREVTGKVNGGLNGLTDRINKYNNCESFIDCITN
jgi:putative chitinase